MDHIATQIHALLFAEGGALTFQSLVKSIGCSSTDLTMALDNLATKLEGTGIALVRSDTEAALAIAGPARDVVLKKATDEYVRDIGDAGLEVIAVLLYDGPMSRTSIDYLRGVNSSSTIRNLLTRGLIERSGNPTDGREFIYRPTTDLYAHIGVTDRDNLPEYGIIAPELAAYKQNQEVNQSSYGTESTTGSSAQSSD